MNFLARIGRGKRIRAAARLLASDSSSENYASLAREYVMVGDTVAFSTQADARGDFVVGEAATLLAHLAHLDLEEEVGRLEEGRDGELDPLVEASVGTRGAGGHRLQSGGLLSDGQVRDGVVS